MSSSCCKGSIFDQGTYWQKWWLQIMFNLIWVSRRVRTITFTLIAVFFQLITFRTRTVITSFGIYTSLTATMELFSWITFIDVYTEIEKNNNLAIGNKCICWKCLNFLMTEMSYSAFFIRVQTCIAGETKHAYYIM